MTTIYRFRAFYTKAGVGSAPSDTPTLTAVDMSGSVIVNAANATKVTNLAGLVIYDYSGADGLELVGSFHTTDTTLDKPYDLPSYPLVCQGAAADVLKLNGATPNNLAAGALMDLVNAPNATAVAAIQSGLSTLNAAGVRGAVGMASANLDTQIAALPTAGAIDTELSASHGAGSWLSGGGSGAIDWHDQFIVTVDGSPRDGVFCRFTTDLAGTNVVATGTTNTFGKLDSLMLDAGTYYVWLQLAGVNFTNPYTEVVA